MAWHPSSRPQDRPDNRFLNLPLRHPRTPNDPPPPSHPGYNPPVLAITSPYDHYQDGYDLDRGLLRGPLGSNFAL
jgi:hypothetical protein